MSPRDGGASGGYVPWLLEQLDVVPGVTARPMFGGTGLYCGGQFFGIVMDEAVHFRTDDSSRPAYEARGMTAFRPSPGQSSRTYYEVPSEVLEDPDELAEWVRAAVAASSAKKRAKKPGTKRRSS